MLSGIPASPGVAFGPARIVKRIALNINQERLPDARLPQEIALFFDARQRAIAQLQHIQQQAHKNCGTKEAAIFEAHCLLLEDDELAQEIIACIKQHNMALEAAIHAVIEAQAQTLEQLEDDYLKARAADVRDIGLRLLQNSGRAGHGKAGIVLDDLPEPVILVTDDLSPSEMAQLDLDKVLGFITNVGSRTSHTAIMACSLALPAIVGVTQATEQIREGDYVVLDAVNNAIYCHPTAEQLQPLRALQQRCQQERQQLERLKHQPTITLDGYPVTLSANIGHYRDLSQLQGATGVGLFRTEFLFMERDALPSEEEQMQAYKAIVQQIGGEAVVIRTLDVGGDKPLPYLPLPKESNPFLGCRGIRITQQHQGVLETQLRAILRASAFGTLHILFPMIIAVEEVRALKTLLERLKEQLQAENHRFDPQIQIGVMIETPAAVAIASHLAREVDFFSIGTNDLIQYTLAVDRDNPLVAPLCQPLSPAVLILIKQVLEAANHAGKWVSLCGELAGDEQATALLIGMGLNKFSMSANAIPRIKRRICATHLGKAQQLAAQVLRQPTHPEVLALITTFMDNNGLTTASKAFNESH